MFTLLTKTGGLLGPFASLFGLIMNGIYEFFRLFGIQNIALSIIIFTIISRALMLPLSIKQQKFSKMSSRMNPELQKIQAKYKGKKDQASLQKMQAENQAVYQKYGANPTSGCLPMLISLPIMLALYQVINNIPAYVGHVYNLYETIAVQIQGNTDFATILAGVAKNVKNNTISNFTDIKQIINFLDNFNLSNWTELLNVFPALNNEAVTGTIAEIKNVNTFLDLNISNSPSLYIFTMKEYKITAFLVPVLAAGLQFFQSKQLQSKTQNDKDNPMSSTMNSMNVVMPLMTLFFCFTFPIGIGLYWIAGSVFAIVQQYFVNKYLDKVNVDELIQKNVKKASKRNAYLESKGISMSELAKKQTKYIESASTGKSTDSSVKTNEASVESSEDIDESIQVSSNPKSISEIANLLKHRNEKGDK